MGSDRSSEVDEGQSKLGGRERRPHPLAPDQPPFNVLIGVPVAVLDRVVTTARQVVEPTLLRKAG